MHWGVNEFICLINHTKWWQRKSKHWQLLWSGKSVTRVEKTTILSLQGSELVDFLEGITTVNLKKYSSKYKTVKKFNQTSRKIQNPDVLPRLPLLIIFDGKTWRHLQQTGFWTNRFTVCKDLWTVWPKSEVGRIKRHFYCLSSSILLGYVLFLLQIDAIQNVHVNNIYSYSSDLVQ